MELLHESQARIGKLSEERDDAQRAATGGVCGLTKASVKCDSGAASDSHTRRR